MKNAPNGDVDIYPPNQVLDLKVSTYEHFLIVNFTSPGDDYDDGTGEFCYSISAIHLSQQMCITSRVLGSTLCSKNCDFSDFLGLCLFLNVLIEVKI